MKYYNQHFSRLLLAGLCLYGVSAQAEVKYSIGAKLLPAHQWNGSNNRDGEKNFSARSTQLMLVGAFRNDRIYGAYSFQGGSYEFGNPAPDINTAAGAIPVQDETVKLAESDLSIGYYITPKVSLFADIKSVGYNWIDQNQNYAYTGLGVGVSAVHPFDSNLALYGNFGVIGKMAIRSKGENIGDGSGVALEIGFISRINNALSASAGLKIQGQELRFDSGAKQNHARSGLVFGIVHQF